MTSQTIKSLLAQVGYRQNVNDPSDTLKTLSLLPCSIKSLWIFVGNEAGERFISAFWPPFFIIFFIVLEQLKVLNRANFETDGARCRLWPMTHAVLYWLQWGYWKDVRLNRNSFGKVSPGGSLGGFIKTYHLCVGFLRSLCPGTRGFYQMVPHPDIKYDESAHVSERRVRFLTVLPATCQINLCQIIDSWVCSRFAYATVFH